ncbi:MAG: A-macroglobulin complement component, partial [Planctomycetes bacterium]|nr:A-macroglobulin complement component [Planctomycetota bacterium]
TTIVLDGKQGGAGRGRALLPIEVLDFVGTTTIELEARAGRFVDRVRHELVVAPRGFPHRRSAGGQVTADAAAEWHVTIPADAVPNSGQATLVVYPSPIAALTEGLEGILREPHGCFEQASSSNYPNTLVLNLIEANGDDLPMVAARARELLPRGYAKITGYECSEKGYEWFGNDPGHEALTAYGLLQFSDMAKVYDVDAQMVERTRNWLLARRDGKGNYPHAKVDHHSFGGRDPKVTNAYVTYALLQAGTSEAELQVEIDALVARIDEADPYELAVIACALNLTERAEARAARERLASLQVEDGSVPGANNTITMSGGRDRIVETTGFAVLAWLRDPSKAANVRAAVEYLQSARSGRGTFGATQATIVALRALTEYATAHRAMRKGGVLQVFEGDRLLVREPFEASDTKAMKFELWSQLEPGDHTLRIALEGGGESPLPWAGEVHYHAEVPADDPLTQTAITARLRAATVEEGRTVALDVVVANVTDDELPTPMAVVGLPAGLEIATEVLEDMKKAGQFAFWELRGRELVLYWRKLDGMERRELTFDLTARVPGTTRGPASRTWLYYTPEQKQWAAPLEIEVRATR